MYCRKWKILKTDRQTDRQYPYKYRFDRLCGCGEYAKGDERGYDSKYRKLTGQGEFSKFSASPSDKIGGVQNSLADELSQNEEFANILNEKMKNKKGGSNHRLSLMLGMLSKDDTIKANLSDVDKSMFSQEKYKFFLDAPFEISSKCCNIMKKDPAHKYHKETGRVPIIATMASESRLRTQKWLQHGCNGFDLKIPTSNPMSFWTEQDVLLYIKINNLPICSVYGDVVVDYSNTDVIEGQMSISDFEGMGEMGIFEKDNLPLRTTGCSRTGCVCCAYGAHCEKAGEGRFEMLKETHPQMYKILDVAKNNGVTMREAIDWTNEHGNLHIRY